MFQGQRIVEWKTAKINISVESQVPFSPKRPRSAKNGFCPSEVSHHLQQMCSIKTEPYGQQALTINTASVRPPSLTQHTFQTFSQIDWLDKCSAADAGWARARRGRSWRLFGWTYPTLICSVRKGVGKESENFIWDDKKDRLHLYLLIFMNETFRSEATNRR